MISQTILHYRILHQLDAGGMGEAYLIQDARLNRKVALKHSAVNDRPSNHRFHATAHLWFAAREPGR